MKKLLFILSLIITCSCNYNPETIADSNNRHKVKVFHYVYNNHYYIRFGNIGLEHDPDCKACKTIRIERTINTASNENHEVWVIKENDHQFVAHCDNCKYCITQNPEGNPD